MNSTILCVDNDRNLCQILEKALVSEGYRVVTAFDGEQAYALLCEEQPDLLVVDVLLPKVDGFGLLEKIRELPEPLGQVPALMLTGCSITPSYKERAKGLRAKALLSKPVPLERLLGLVKKYTKAPPPRVVRRRARMEAVEAPPLAGSLEELSFPHLLHHLHGLRATGALLLTNGRRRKALQVRDGYPVAVKSNLVNECLGNRLVRQGKLSQDAMNESLLRMKKGEGLQGQILLAMQVMDEAELSAELRAQAEEKLFEVFAWAGGDFKFQIGARLQRANSLALESSPANVILEGVRRRFPVATIDAFLVENAERFVAPGESPFYRFQEIDLSEEQQAVLDRVRGTRTLGEFVSEAETVRRTLFGLLVTELVDLRGEGCRVPAAARSRRAPDSSPEPQSDEDRELRAELAARAEKLRRMSYFEMLGVDEDADEEALRAAHGELAERSHPDRFSSASAAVRQLADDVFQLISRAYETLSDPKRRTEYVLEVRKGQREAAREAESRRALEAEVAFQKGDALLRQRDYQSALAQFGRALSQNSDEGEYHAHYGWCLHLCHADDSNIAEEAIEHIRRGIKLAGDREKPFLYLGRLYKAVGRGAAAEKMFTRAVQIRPDCVEAMRELRLITMRRQKSRGLMGRLKIFRR